MGDLLAQEVTLTMIHLAYPSVVWRHFFPLDDTGLILTSEHAY